MYYRTKKTTWIVDRIMVRDRFCQNSANFKADVFFSGTVGALWSSRASSDRWSDRRSYPANEADPSLSRPSK